MLSVLFVVAFLAAAVLMATGVLSGELDEVADGFEYKIIKNHVKITRYVGGDANVVIPETIASYPVAYLDGSSFENLTRLVSVVIPSTITEIEGLTFANCENLKSVVLSPNTKSIDVYAFSGCSSLESITIPQSVTFIHEDAFYGCGALRTLTVEKGNKVYHSAGNCIIETATKTLVRGCKTSVIPSNGSVTVIGDASFGACRGLTKITIPKGVTTIGKRAFMCCFNLKSVTLSDTVKVIDERAFLNCNSLESIKLSSNLQSIGDNAFEWCEKLQNVKLPKTLISIGARAFGDCDKIKSIVIPKSVTSVTGKIVENSTKIYYCGTSNQWKKIAKGQSPISANQVNFHDYAPYTCTKAKTCKLCGGTVGRKLGHYYTNKCDKTCDRCGNKRTITHTYKNVATVKATLKKNGTLAKKCSVCGYVASKTAIKYVKTVKLAANSFVYNGKQRTPAVTVKNSAGKVLKKGTDYTVTYATGRKNVGTYKVTVKMKGKYSGTKTLSFKILPKATYIKSLAQGVKSIAVAWAPKSEQMTGYQIQYSTAKNFSTFKTVTVSDKKKTSHTVKNLASNKTYYVRIRTYKVVNKTKLFSGWSAVKSVKTK